MLLAYIHRKPAVITSIATGTKYICCRINGNVLQDVVKLFVERSMTFDRYRQSGIHFPFIDVMEGLLLDGFSAYSHLLVKMDSK